MLPDVNPLPQTMATPSGAEHSTNRLFTGVLNSLTEAVNNLSRGPPADQGGGGGRRGDCYECGESSHFKRDCPQLARKTVEAAATEEKCRHCGGADHYSRGCKRANDSSGKKATPGGSPSTTCARCGKVNHEAATCWASYHKDGTELDPTTKGAEAPKRGGKRRRF